MVLTFLKDHIFANNYFIILFYYIYYYFTILFSTSTMNGLEEVSHFVSNNKHLKLCEIFPTRISTQQILLHVACKHDSVLGNVEEVKVIYNWTWQHSGGKRRHMLKIGIMCTLQAESVLRIRVICERDEIGGGKISTSVRIGWPRKKKFRICKGNLSAIKL